MTSAIAANARTTIPTRLSVELCFAGAVSTGTTCGERPARSWSADVAVDGSLMPLAAANFLTAVDVGAETGRRRPARIGTPASRRYADLVECPGQLNPKPSGITTSSRCL